MMNRKYYLHILGTAVVAVLCSIANNFSVGVGAAETLSASDALVSEAKREPIYKKIPSNSFVQAMYRIGERFVEYQKSVGKKSVQQAAHR